MVTQVLPSRWTSVGTLLSGCLRKRLRRCARANLVCEKGYAWFRAQGQRGVAARALVDVNLEVVISLMRKHDAKTRLCITGKTYPEAK